MKFNEKDIAHFFKGKLSENKAKKFLIWLNSKEGEEAYNSHIENLWNKESERDQNLKEAELHTSLNTPEHLVTEDRSQSKRIKLHYPNLLKIAASLLAILSISYLFYLNQNIDSKENQVAQIVPK